MRSIISAVAVLFGLVLTGIAVPGIWLDRNIAREDGFVALAAPLGKEPAFQESLADAILMNLDVGQAVPGPLQPVVQEWLTSALESLYGLPNYGEAWEETLRRSHRLSFALEGTSGPDQEAVTTLTLDVAPLVRLAADALESGLGQPIPAPDQTLIHLGEPTLRQLAEMLSAYAPLAYPLGAVAGASLLLGLLAARSRWLVLLATGAGGLVLAGVWTHGIGAAEAAVLGVASGNEVADMLKAEFAAAASASFAGYVLMALIAAVAVLASALVARGFHRPSAPRTPR